MAFTSTSGYPGSRWLTVRELELRRDAMAAMRDRRLGRLRRGTAPVPDGVLVRPGGNAAIEVELMAKTTKEYERLFRW